ncbi:MAG: transglycosylase domain-containing protein [Acidimicrobiales bacterium]
MRVLTTLRPLRRLLRLGALAVVLVFLVLAAACSYQRADRRVALPENAETTRIYAADGALITALHAGQNRSNVRYAELPAHLVDAVVAIEDERFWRHQGIDLKALLRATRTNAETGELTQGGSTITQQLVKNALLEPDKTLSRKLTEASLALQLEQAYSKERILELYLNTIYFGKGAYGVEAASQRYFAKPVSAVTLGEAALLAGLIRAPSVTDPFDAPEAAMRRRGLVLGKLLDLGYIDQGQHDAAAAEALTLAGEFGSADRYPAAHFVEEVKKWIAADERFGPTPEARRDLLFRGGLRIHTTVDLRLQAAAEEAVASVLPDPGEDPEGAVAAVEPATGFVRAMAGGRDYFGDSPFAKYNLAVGAGRQAGSSFKPLVLAAALEKGIPLTKSYPAPGRITLDAGPGFGAWAVSNYEGGGGGSASLLEATVHSYNTVYAQLMLDVGPAAGVEMATRLGVTSPLAAVPAAVLGTENVTPLDMASAYATLANRGVRVPPTLVTRVERPDGSILYEHAHEQRKVIPIEVADRVTSALGQVVARGTGTRAQLGRPAAGKTGTAQEYRDAWFVGYTPELAAAVWVGFAERQEPMTPPRTPIRVTGGSWPAQIWRAFMVAALADTAPSEFPAAEQGPRRRPARPPADAAQEGPVAGGGETASSVAASGGATGAADRTPTNTPNNTADDDTADDPEDREREPSR